MAGAARLQERVMVYPIVRFGDPVLEREAAEVTEFDTPELHKFLDDMFESMYVAKGVGLAAPQIGVSRRIAVIDVSNGERPEDKLVLINPTILKVDGRQEGELAEQDGGENDPFGGDRHRAERRRLRGDGPGLVQQPREDPGGQGISGWHARYGSANSRISDCGIQIGVARECQDMGNTF